MKSYRNVSYTEMHRATLKEKNKMKELVIELKTGEKSGLTENFDSKAFIKKLHLRYLNNKI